MICPHCGYDNHESATYCEKCGGKLVVREAENGSDETVAFGGSTEAGRTNTENGRTEYYAGWNGDWGSPQDDGGYQENRCRRCGSLLDNDCKYCPVCGEPVPGRQMQMPPKPSGDSGNNSKSLTKQILIVLLVLFLLIDGILAGYYFYSRDNSEDASVEEESEDTDSQEETSDGESVAEGTSTPQPTPTKEPEVVHTYEYYIDNCSWEEAYQKCKEQNGYLVRIESAEEYETICREIKAKGMQNYMFFIGARRDPGTSSYYWIDENNVITGEPINDVNSPLNSYWMANEPSFTDGAIEETCMEMNFYSGENRWVINDVPNELIDVVPEFTGKIGYICEYEITR